MDSSVMNNIFISFLNWAAMGSYSI